jgi:ATP-binding cassette subfamily B (MDR/TAP) protein 1
MRSSLFVLLVAFGDGLFAGLKYSVMEAASLQWINSLRRKNYPRILSQDKKWFDEPQNSPERIVHILMKDGDDARELIATVLVQFVLVTSMLTVGFVWALVLGWQLTLAGLAFAPVFAVIMAVQSRMISKFELRNKRLREEVARQYHDMIANIREIRSMSFERVFTRQFNKSVDSTYRSGLVGGFAEGSTAGIASALTYLAEGQALQTVSVSHLTALSSPVLHRRYPHGQWPVHLPSNASSPQSRRLHRYHRLTTSGFR